MKTMKLTTIALALIATAIFTSSAKAAGSGDIILGVYDLNTGTVPTSYEVDLGAFNTLTAGETFNIGTSLGNVYTADSSANLVFDIFATGGTTGGGTLAAKELAVTGPAGLTLTTGSNVSPNTDILGVYQAFTTAANSPLLTGTSSTGTSFTAVSVPNGTVGSFEGEYNNSGGSFGLGGQPALLTSYPTSSDITLYTITNKTSGTETPVAYGTFQFSGTGAGTTLTFDPTVVAAPEPSTYALLAGGLLALLMIKRRRSNA